MAVASNPLLQANSGVGAAKGANALAGSSPSKPASFTNDAGQSFSQVYASQQPAAAFNRPDTASKASGHAFDAADNKPSAPDHAPGAKDQVAAGGKDLPAKANDRPSGNDKASSSAKADTKPSPKDKADVADDSVSADDQDDDLAVDDGTLKDPLAQMPPTAPTPEPTVAASQPQPEAVVPPPVVQPQPAVQAAAASTDGDESGPPGDALADLPMVRMALEHNAKANGTTSAHALDDDHAASQGGEKAEAQPFSEVLDTLAQGKSAGQGDASQLGNAPDDEHQPGAGPERSTRLEDFATRLQGLSGPAVTDTAKAQASAAAQPLQMQQSGWTEGLVNRVMYLSSQNLKSADIKLNPLELGRLDIRVDVTADQQTQVTFSSAHIAVREALESQQGRLRDMLAQQGLNNVDVNVADQSRQQQQQQQQQQAQASQRGQGSGERGGNGGRGTGADEGLDAIEAPAAQAVVGSSLVDYYA
ncbi:MULTISPECIES: flagellar hook-length control protein FliK [unclassified Pseudomonas]|uniref:flagellar hook-length control protein FliK n=1 Tax=unclassified Pseudomonas TaxID=196821 RepID=UPI000BD02218|nr:MULTISPECIES: flagellar hook-length control protein FliK [unclassified Pseudomonas]PVZ13704.1 flagellar hook-length control protein FliK [Pseudomonas sp. URIL14HWK12:I12]PVZ24010.1 flagellar hook-length control protein FliK [Pseudomonas sp. URIL14HWK12:I10]PVZ33351.1 flagellar hook-length control protein FliK [Pseudomonas sp. URIL14HWK12:I11]SNZ11253.1 flagellar hook-length control protein FliK [Pseudomonas sp. URIL14HWK12:I9]